MDVRLRLSKPGLKDNGSMSPFESLPPGVGQAG